MKLQNAVTIILRGTFTDLNTYIRKEEISKMNLNFYLRKLGKKEQFNPKASRRKGYLKLMLLSMKLKTRKQQRK